MTTNIDALAQGNTQVPNVNAPKEEQPAPQMQSPAAPQNQPPQGQANIPPLNPPVQPETQPPASEKEKPEQNEPVTHEQMASDAKGVLDTVKLDSATVEQEWFANGGKLNDETYAALEKAGISKDIVNNYGHMLQEKQSQSFESQKVAYMNAIDGVTGGREKTAELITFMGSGAVPAGEYQELHKQLDSGNAALGTAAINRLKVLHEQRFGRAGSPVQGMHTPSVGHGDTFNSPEEAQLAFNATLKGDPREQDAKQKMVMDKLTRTNKARTARGERPFFTA